MKKPCIIFTGGGSGGHVMPAITLIENLRDKYNIFYIGSSDGIEKTLISQRNIPYKAIPTGKLRRYVSFKNFTDIFRIFAGIIYAFFYLLSFPKNTLVFSTGGFVAVPVVIAAFFQRKKIFIHEQTSRAGLANKISSFFAKKVFITFEDSKKYFPARKTVFSGYPVKKECLDNIIRTEQIKGIYLKSPYKPILFITGGGNGSSLLNNMVKNNLNELKKDFIVFHQAGKQFYNDFVSLEDNEYKVFSFIDNQIIDIFKSSQVIITRAGAGTVCELMALGKRAIFVPLKIAQKNEQYHNAMLSRNLSGSYVIEEDDFKKQNILALISDFINDKTKKNPFEMNLTIKGTQKIIKEITEILSGEFDIIG
jgi:UDP-N-acetylglucosamine--N-acetylmuramyl-(pentapeptide) pyrophosphoryl-undecaprenol N-acetylglucosamine transferase